MSAAQQVAAAVAAAYNLFGSANWRVAEPQTVSWASSNIVQVSIREERELPLQVNRLVEIGIGEGFTFVGRFVAEWASGRNRFNRPGELCLFAYLEGTLVGFGGLNLDPYQTQPTVGRIRHVYVEPARRGHGIGGALVRRLVGRARPAFSTLRLSTQQAAPFYEHLGFAPVLEHKATHKLELNPVAAT